MSNATGANPAIQTFLTNYEKEHATTMRVLKAFPEDKRDFKPHPRCNTVGSLAFTVVQEQMLAVKALTTGFDWSVPPASRPGPPDTLAGTIAAVEEAHQKVLGLVKALSDEQIKSETVSFYVAPKTLGDIPKLEFLWMLLHDQIHHRGQLTIYLRMVDGKVPSIYGPTADEPWN